MIQFTKKIFLSILLLIPLLTLLSNQGKAFAESSYTLKPFPDFGACPTSKEGDIQYSGTLFELSQDYPRTKPPESHIPPFLKQGKYPDRFNPDPSKPSSEQDWYQYLMDVRRYAFQGNINNDWRVERNTQRDWYHMPWLHWGDDKASECVHGLIQEAPLHPQQLDPSQDRWGTAFAASFYNSFGGYHIGQVWADPNNPNPSADNSKFPVGTVITKLLFTNITDLQVPFLKEPIEWEAYVAPYDPNKGPDGNSLERRLRPLRLIQMDVMVRDKGSPTGWTFGTLVYNGNQSQDNRWKNLQPVGLQWGDDPNVTDNLVNSTPTETKINPKLEQTAINRESSLPAQHLGWGYRLSGPVDNARSSCMSCHSTAEYPQLSKLSPSFLSKQEQPKPGSKEWMKWFRNLKAGEPFDSEAISTDFSLLLATSIQNYYKWKNQNLQGYYIQEFPQDKEQTSITGKTIHRQQLSPEFEIGTPN